MTDPIECSKKMVLVFPKKMSQCIRLYADRYLKDTKIKPQYLPIIHYIGMSDGISQKSLNEEMPYDKSYISMIVRDLTDMGLVYNDSTGKAQSLHLTEQGTNVFAMCRMMSDLLDSNLFTVLTREEFETLEVIMAKLDSRLDEMMAQIS